MKFGPQQVQHWDGEIRAGRGRGVAEELSRLDVGEIPRRWLWPIAKIARRTGCFVLGLKILSPVIHPHKRAIRAAPSPEELAEHSALLIQMGAIREGLQILSEIDSAVVADVLLYRSYGHFNRWEYGAAIPLLESYLETPLDPYSRVVGQLNLAAACIVERQEMKALSLLESIAAYARENSFGRILGNCFELRAQIDLRAERWEAASASLNQATDFLKGDQSTDRFFVRKWTVILEALRDRNRAVLTSLRRETLERGEWETLREIDLNSLKITFDQTTFNCLFFGTPYATYRDRIATELRTHPTEDELIIRQGRLCFDFESGELFDGKPDQKRLLAKAPALVRQVLQSLIRDFYRPVRLGGLFSELYQRDYFDVNSSPNRVHQALHRTRTWLKQNLVSLEIHETSGHFRLALGQGLSFKIPLHNHPMDNYSLRLNKLKQQFLDQAFSSRQARETLQLKAATFNKFAATAVESRHLERTGAGSAIYYRLAG